MGKQKTAADRIKRRKGKNSKEDEKKPKKGQKTTREFDGETVEGEITGARGRIGGGDVVKEEYHEGDTKIKTKTDEEGEKEKEVTKMKNINPASLLQRLMAKREVSEWKEKIDPETGKPFEEKVIEKKVGEKRIRAKVKRRYKKS
tara:strand:+ start:2466 stop:2900 length:435 start_codon:yes stop_codon:yes gene_type:complete